MYAPRTALSALVLILFTHATSFAQTPALVIPTGHSHFVWSVALSPDGRFVASGCKDRTVKLWDATTGQLLSTLAHPVEVWSVAISPDGRMLASGGTDQIVRLWEVASGRQVRELRGHTASIYSLAYSPDGRTLASGSWDGTINLWDMAAKPDAAVAPRATLAHADLVMSVAFSPDGRTLASGGSGKENTASGSIKLWQVDTAAELRTLTESSGAVNAVAFSRDGQQLASGSAGKEVKVWEVATAQPVLTLRGHESSVESVAYSADGRVLATSGENIRLWDARSGRPLRTLPQTSHSLDFGKDGQALASAAVGGVALWDAGTGQLTRTLRGRASPVTDIAFSPTGDTMVTVGADLTLWDLNAGLPLSRPNIHHPNAQAVAFSPSGQSLASAGVDRVIKLWELNTGQEPRTLNGHMNQINSIAYSPDGRLLASGSGGFEFPGIDTGNIGTDYTVRLWAIDTGRELFVLRGHKGPVYAVAFSPDGRTLASGSGDGTVKLWDVRSGRERRTMSWYVYAVMALAFSPDGRTLASANYDRIIFWNTATGAQLRRIDSPVPPDNSVNIRALTALAFSPDGRTLASGGTDTFVRIWDAASGRLRHTLGGHASPVSSVAFRPQGHDLISGSADMTTRVWDAASGRELLSLIVFDRANWFAATPDGLFDGTPDAWNQMLWRYSPNTFDVRPVEVFFGDFFRQGLVAQVMAGERLRAARGLAQLDRRQPEVELTLAAPASTRIDTRHVPVVIDVTEPPSDGRAPAGGARDVRLFRNGALVRTWRGEINLKGGRARLETTVPITAGVNRLTAYAFNRDNVKSRDALLQVTGADSLKRAATNYVLAVGIDDYANRSFNLKHAAADARSFAEAIQRRNSQLGRDAPVAVKLLINQDATRANILAALARLAAEAQPEDEVIVYFAGHGFAHRERFYLVPHDLGYTGDRNLLAQAALRQPALRSIAAHSISDEELERAFEGLDAGRTLLVIDACNSGQALEATERRRGPMNVAGLAQLAYEKGMYVLTAAQSYQAAIESAALKHGYLTYSLVVDGLDGFLADDAPRDGRILAREWLDYSANRVPQLVRRPNYKTPGRGGKRDLVIGGGADDVQTPRVFYRRELELETFLIAERNAQRGGARK